jgi:hypothetical protein
MRKFAFIIFLFLNVNVSSALATEYGALAVASPQARAADAPWHTAIALHQPDPHAAQVNAMQECRRLSGEFSSCSSIVFKSGQCVAFTLGIRRQGDVTSISHYLSIGASEKLAAEENERRCSAHDQRNDRCLLQRTLCQPYSSSLDKVLSIVTNFIEETRVEYAFLALLAFGYWPFLLYFTAIVLFFVVFAAAVNRHWNLPSHFWPMLRRIAVAWCFWAALTFYQSSDYIWFSGYHFPFTLFPPFTTMFAYYVVIGLIVLMCRFFWQPSIPFLRTRAYPILIVSVLIPLVVVSIIAGSKLIYDLDLSPEVRALVFKFLPYFPYGVHPMYLPLGLFALAVLALVPRSDPPPFAELRGWLKKFFGVGGSRPSQAVAPSDNTQQAYPLPVSAATAPNPPSYDLPPGQPIALKLKRTQKPGFNSLIYMLDARIDVSAEVRALIAKHNLGSRVIYESSDRQKHAENVQAHLADSHSQTSLFAPPSEQVKGAAKTFWKLGRAAVSAARAALALRVTVNSLLSGVHVECKSMEELLEAEDAFREAKVNLEGYIAAAQTFDGREEII